MIVAWALDGATCIVVMQIVACSSPARRLLAGQQADAFVWSVGQANRAGQSGRAYGTQIELSSRTRSNRPIKDRNTNVARDAP
jgi:hypothetical protein